MKRSLLSRSIQARLSEVFHPKWILLLFWMVLGPLRWTTSLPIKPSFSRSSFQSRRLFSQLQQHSEKRIAIIGGGLAGLSTAYHLLEKTNGSAHVTVFDKAPVGTSGASAVAGGLLHPLSPRGKLVHWGREGLASANRLLQAATYPDRIVLRPDILRVALTKDHVQQLKTTAAQMPDICEWLEPSEFQEILPETNEAVLGCLRLHNGCKTIHVPSYLQGLWEACEALGGNYQILPETSKCEWGENLQEFDSVVLAAGSGLFDNLLPLESFPVRLVRGQSVILDLPTAASNHPALLCGKYVSPLPGNSHLMVGATHEFRPDALSPERVLEELKERTSALVPHVWKDPRVDRIESGFRVQSERGKYGRQPIVGRLYEDKLPNFPSHAQVWVFTGLSSRGLLYHGVYGDVLTDAILCGSDDEIFDTHEHLNWWRIKEA